MREATVEGDDALPELRRVREATQKQRLARAAHMRTIEAQQAAWVVMHDADEELERAWVALRNTVHESTE